MAKSKDTKPKVYTRCLAQANGASLWLAEDHVMQATGGRGLTESYRRFYFRDLQAITERQTNQGITSTLTTAIVLLLVVVFSAFVIGTGAENSSYGVIAGLVGFVVFVVPVTGYISLRGRDVMVRFRTATQEVGITAIATEKTLSKVLDVIQPLIMAAQADMDAENLLARGAEKNGKLVERSSRRFSSVRSTTATPKTPSATGASFAAAGRPKPPRPEPTQPEPTGREGFSPMPTRAPVATDDGGESEPDAMDDALWDLDEPGLATKTPDAAGSETGDDIPPAGDGESDRPAL